MPKSNIKEVIVLIHEWITRAGVLPLALSLVSHRDQAIVEAVLDAFVQYASRWEHFHYRYMGDIPITFPEFGDMPYLRSFSLHGDHFEDAKLQISSWPMLTTLSWPLHPTASSSPSIPWHQLTHLTLEHFMTARETLLVIQSCPKLTELNIESYSDGGNVQDQPPPGIAVVNNSLRKLVLNVDESCTRLLKELALPVLIDMTLYFVSPCVPRVHSELLHFFTRSKCKLDRLHLVDPEFCDDMLLRCLEHDSCTSITDLSLTNEYGDPMVTDAVLYMLTAVPSSDSDMLVPNLAHLEFHMCLSASPGRLGMMLLSRCIMWDEGDRLKTVKIEHYSLSRLDIALVALAETHGLKVTFDVEESDSDYVKLEI
ncbi:hypothetical protein F5887DRAFT_1193488 [Amanita rubescens]|nr:hypothetical protein F5887DRAFT_1193488 [Amanita rubescens]